MKHIFHLVRHGQKKSIMGDPELTDEGKSQAALTANYFSKKHKVHKVFTSPLLRTKQTAEIIASKSDAKVTETILLKERANWGENPEQSFDEFLAMWNMASTNRDWQPPIGDSSKQAGMRLSEVLKLASNEDVTEIVLVTHGGIIVDFLRNIYTDIELDKKITMFSQIFENIIPECSITTVEYEDGNVTVTRIAYIDHLKVGSI